MSVFVMDKTGKPLMPCTEKRARLENPEISGVEYQPGTLAGFEVREYR